MARRRIDLDALQRSWTSAFTALDQIDSYRRSALASMPAAVAALSAPVTPEPQDSALRLG